MVLTVGLKWSGSPFPKSEATFFFRSLMSSTQIDVASCPGQRRASRHTGSCTCIAVVEDVAAAQIELPSTPECVANIVLSARVVSSFTVEDSEISDTGGP